MRWKRFVWGMGLCLAVGGSQAWAGDAPAPSASLPSSIVSMQAPSAQPSGNQQPGPQGPPAESLLPQNAAPTTPSMADTSAAPSAPEAGTGGPGSASPNMLGDFLGVPRPSFRAAPAGRHGPARQVRAGASPSSSAGPDDEPPGFASIEPDADDGTAFGALVARGAFKIADDESPRPQDRFFLRFNYFNGVGDSVATPDLSRTDVYREVVGFEKTFLDGNASIGVRLPFIDVQGDPSVRKDAFGDLSVILKYAFINECNKVLSAGVVVTAPTGARFEQTPFSPTIHDTLVQPYIGALYDSGKYYVHGFSSVLIPTEDDDITLLFNDVGVGYYLYKSDDRDSTMNFIAPTVEAHVTTPLNHRGIGTGPVSLTDIVDLTGGVTFVLCGHSTLTFGFVDPVTGPKPFNYEAQAYLNWKF